MNIDIIAYQKSEKKIASYYQQLKYLIYPFLFPLFLRLELWPTARNTTGPFIYCSPPAELDAACFFIPRCMSTALHRDLFSFSIKIPSRVFGCIEARWSMRMYFALLKSLSTTSEVDLQQAFRILKKGNYLYSWAFSLTPVKCWVISEDLPLFLKIISINH